MIAARGFASKRHRQERLRHLVLGGLGHDVAGLVGYPPVVGIKGALDRGVIFVAKRHRQECLCYSVLGGLGHDVTGLGGEAGAFELDRSVVNLKFSGGFFLNGGEEFLAFVHMHVGNAGVKAERIVAAA